MLEPLATVKSVRFQCYRSARVLLLAVIAKKAREGRKLIDSSLSLIHHGRGATRRFPDVGSNLVSYLSIQTSLCLQASDFNGCWWESHSIPLQNSSEKTTWSRDRLGYQVCVLDKYTS